MVKTSFFQEILPQTGEGIVMTKENENLSSRAIRKWEGIGWLVTFAFVPSGSNLPGLLILLGVRLFRWFKHERPPYPESATPKIVFWTNRLIMAFLVLVVLSSLFSRDKINSLAWSLGFLVLFFVYTFGSQPFGYQTPPFLQGKYLPVFGISSVIILIYSLAAYYITSTPRTTTLFFGNNGWATVLIIMTGFMMGYLLWRRGKYRYLLIPYFGLVLPVLFLTQSRGGWFGFATMLGIFSLFNRKVLIVFLIILLISGCVIWGVPTFQERFLSSFSYEQNISRIFIWKATIRMIQDHPLLGIGTGNYFTAYPQYRLPGAWETKVAFSHNLFLEVAVEFGLVGLILFCLFLSGIIYMGLSLALTGNPIYQGIFAAFAGVLVHQQVDLPIWSIAIGGIFWMLVGLMIGMYRYEFGGKCVAEKG